MQLMSNIKLAAQIRSINTKSSKLREQIQDVLISCAYHAMKDGQITPFNDLLKAVGSNTRVKGITMWAEKFGCVMVKDDKFVLNKSAKAKTDVTCEDDFAPYYAEMVASKWYDVAPKEVKTSIFEATTYLDGVAKRLEKENQVTIADEVRTLINKIKSQQLDMLAQMQDALI